MTATTSTKNKNMFAVRFSNDLKDSSRLFWVSVFLNVLGLPMGVIAVLVESYNQQHQIYTNGSAAFIMIAVIALILYIAMGIVIALFHFRYLYTKSIVDMNYSLPLNNKQRFSADYLSGLFVYFVPLVVGILLALVVYGIGSQFVHVIEEISVMIPHMFISGFIVVIGMLMLYTLAVLAITFCGSTFEAIFSVTAVNGIIPAVIACVWLTIVRNNGFGLIDTAVFHGNPMFGTSPIGSAMFFGKYLEDGFVQRNIYDSISVYTPEYYHSLYIRWLAMALIFTVIYLCIAFVIYSRRKAEDVAKPYISKAFFYGIMSAALFCILSLMLAVDGNPLAAVIVVAIFWFIMEVITRRGFKKFWTAIVSFGITVAASFGFIGLCKATNGFGAVNKIPSANSISCVNIENNDYYSRNYFGSDITFSDKEVIDSVIALHKDIVDHYNNRNNYEYKPVSGTSQIIDQTSIKISYCTKSGSTIERYYQIPSYMISDLMLKKMTCEENAEYRSERMLVSIANTKTDYPVSNKSDALKYMKNAQLLVEDKVYSDNKYYNITKDEAVELSEAYKKDLMEITEDDLKNSEFLGYVSGAFVLSSFRNTLAVLDKMNVEFIDFNAKNMFDRYSVSNVEILDEPGIVTYEKYFYNDPHSSGYFIDYGRYYYEEDNYRSENSVDSMCSMNSVQIGTRGGYLYRLYDTDEFKELMKIATPIIIGEKPIAVINYNTFGTILYVPDRPGNREIFDKAVESLDLIPEEELAQYNNYYGYDSYGNPMPQKVY